MRLSSIAVVVFLAGADVSNAFTASPLCSVQQRPTSWLSSTVEETQTVATQHVDASSNVMPVALSADEINSRLAKQLEKLRQKDQKSPQLKKEDIQVVFQDEHVVVVNKPAGVLCVPTKDGFPNLAQAVFDAYGSGAALDRADKMVVHRLGMETSGLVVLAQTPEAVRGMNAVFRTRNVERTYEALVCGHVAAEAGMIHLPLMRDYAHPPFMRVSTDAHQQVLGDLAVEQVGKKLLQHPKDSLTKYEVIRREELDGQPVTRVKLTSISGRTHQLNVHLAALGHPIVGDSTYGMAGDAAPNGGLTAAEQDAMVPNAARASPEVQKALAGKGPCIHAKSLKFRHPITKQDVSLSVDAPF